MAGFAWAATGSVLLRRREGAAILVVAFLLVVVDFLLVVVVVVVAFLGAGACGLGLRVIAVSWNLKPMDLVSRKNADCRTRTSVSTCPVWAMGKAAAAASFC